MRTFLAVFPSPATQAAAARVIERLRRPDDGVSWVRRENLHFTMRFMGDLDEGGMSRVIAAARDGAAGRPAFTIGLGAAGAFPDPRRARVLWLGLSQGAEPLVALAGSLDRALAEHGFLAADRTFTPHLTLGRVRRGGADWAARLTDVAAEPVSEGAASFTVDRVVVVQSTLSPSGSIYRVRAEAPLAA